mmetsp:Transcript_27175/g.68618  ORF Transcript_27175/g.68618 Transcript_27175/m.68618 type:complete len:129 (+) Transcript_27175:280-666(+)
MVAVTMARSPVELGLIVATARQMGTNGAHFGDSEGDGILGIQHCLLTNAATGETLACTVNSQTVATVRWQHAFFSCSLTALTADQRVILGEIKIRLYTSPPTAAASFGQCIIVEEMWDLQVSKLWHAE